MESPSDMHYRSILEFWFAELPSSAWFGSSAELDSTIARRFGDIHQAALAGELYSWRHKAQGRLAEIIVLDQFSRNIYRDSPRAYAADGQALVLAQEAIRAHADSELRDEQRIFLYMPYMHSESLAIQNASLRLYEALGLENNYRFALAHHDIIARFGRYPHRNTLLGRVSSEAELAFLQEAGSSF
ncbi:DUF924 family protein [Zhongshania marina]